MSGFLKGLFSKKPNLPNFSLSPIDFKRPHEMERMLVRSDQEIGGFTKVNLDLEPETKTGHFHGFLNLDLPKNKPEVTRSGYAMFRTKQIPVKTFFGEKITTWDWLTYDHVALRVKGDRRKYFVNIQSSATPLRTDIYQHRLFLNKPGEWETVFIPLNDFVMTNWGNMVENCDYLERSTVRTIGIGLLDKQHGPFSLHVDWIKLLKDVESQEEIKKTRGEDSKKLTDNSLKMDELV